MSRAEQTGAREPFKPHGGEPLSAPNGPEAAAARALAEAAETGDAARVASLVASGAFADARLRGGETPLMRAAARGYADVARALLDAGADASARRADGFTPLILAAFFGHEEVVRLLLERGADAGARTTLGTTAEKWAASRGFDGVGSLLRGASQARARSGAPKGKASPDASRVKPSGDPLADVGIFSRKDAAEESEASRASAASRPKADEGVAVKNQGGPAVEGVEGALAAASGSSVREGKREKVSISIRDDAPVFSYPSESGFQFWRFMRSWQASIGTAFLLAAIGVGAYALWIRGARENPKPAPTQQPVVQQPAQAMPAQPQATPLAPDAQLLPTPDTNAYPMAGNASQPYYDPPVVNNVPPQSNIPNDLTVVSESGAPAPEAPPKRKPEAGNANVPARPAREGGDPKADADTRGDSDRNARQPDPEPRTAPTARPTPPTPAPSSDPNRGKVIPWPPQ
ncbi:MAG TPA: ankyrin repeat domain-containing protein [Pyrinomonadaceae bacterium]|nr:ankyrin repeat domain-containing protein [Pyrinomonadaceae bacterium]